MLSRLATCSACPALLLLLPYADTNIKNLRQNIIIIVVVTAMDLFFFALSQAEYDRHAKWLSSNTIHRCMLGEEERTNARKRKKTLWPKHISRIITKWVLLSLNKRPSPFVGPFFPPSCNRVVAKEESCSIVFGFAFYANGIRFACSTLSGSEEGYIYSITWCSNDPSCFQSIVFDRLSFLLHGCWFFSRRCHRRRWRRSLQHTEIKQPKLFSFCSFRVNYFSCKQKDK